MIPKTPYGWYNKIVRGYTYNETTANILDHTFKPNHRLLANVDKFPSEDREIKRNNYKAAMSSVRSLLRHHRHGLKSTKDY